MKHIFGRLVNYLIKLSQEYVYNVMRVDYNLPRDFRFNGPGIKIYGDGKISVGSNSYIGSYSTIQLTKGYVVSIGDNCSISHNVRIYTSSKVPDYDFSDKSKVPDKKGNVQIGDGCWIGANVFINPDITIGTNSVIGANSVVTKNLEENGIYGGIPAKLIRFKNLS